MIRFLSYLILLLLLCAAGFAIYSIFVPPEAPNTPIEVEVDLSPDA
ncbi:hypothetical protein [Pontivivens insulae]|uniref:Uncharacterized protein n=1 Tax=Pontivivens insulae TaxID=1639689 RepID=A0A2R8AAT7_9RHOB|nr:hypothetical protein [Pontivivens insulae]RED13241.1 hypothetical protein DFR53_2377 [Pontivivens insulae]SPF29333.1 hypothetical protein POI8812_01641 [Pontivivens insulae]